MPSLLSNLVQLADILMSFPIRKEICFINDLDHLELEKRGDSKPYRIQWAPENRCQHFVRIGALTIKEQISASITLAGKNLHFEPDDEYCVSLRHRFEQHDRFRVKCAGLQFDPKYVTAHLTAYSVANSEKGSRVYGNDAR